MNILKQANNSYAITYVTAFYTNMYVIEVLHCIKMCQYTLYIQKWHSTMHIIGASVSEPPSSDANGSVSYIYIYIYYVSYVVPHILNLSNLTHVTSIKYV